MPCGPRGDAARIVESRAVDLRVARRDNLTSVRARDITWSTSRQPGVSVITLAADNRHLGRQSLS